MSNLSTFGLKDIGLLLSDKVGDAYSIRHLKDHTEQDSFEPLKPKIDQSKKITRYFTGKAPVFAGDADESQYNEDRNARQESGVDRRLARLSKTAKPPKDDSEGVDMDKSQPRRRRVFEAEVVVDGDDEFLEEMREIRHITGNKVLDSDEESTDEMVEGDVFLQPKEDAGNDESSILERRQRVLQRLAEKKNEAASKEVEEEEEEESEYETDSDEYTDDDEVILKPLFVPKHLRETIKEQELKAAEDAKLLEKKKVQKENRQKQTRTMVAESLRRMDEMKEVDVTDADSDAGLPDDMDDPDDVMEFESWKIREIKRLKRDAELREIAEIEKADLLRRRAMTDEERMEEDKKLGLNAPKQKEKWKFMQKYYHKGVFYMDNDSMAADDVRKKDYNMPTLEDNYNYEALPKVLQVKNFGKRGRTKYTHLLDQDTSNFKEALRPDEKVFEKYLNKRGGIGDLDHKKKKKSRND